MGEIPSFSPFSLKLLLRPSWIRRVSGTSPNYFGRTNYITPAELWQQSIYELLALTALTGWYNFPEPGMRGVEAELIHRQLQ